MSITEVRSDNATDRAVAAKVDMKFEIVVIPVSDMTVRRSSTEGSGGGSTLTTTTVKTSV